MLNVNDQAPDFELPDENETAVRLSDFRGEKVLLVFYPGDNTPVCTRQLCDYRDGIDAFRDLGVRVIGVSNDSAESHREFKQKHRLPFTLLTDADLQVAEKYDCKGMLGMKRGVFLVDQNGLLRYVHVETVAIFRRKREELLAVIDQLD